jgi:hypothetical protein
MPCNEPGSRVVVAIHASLGSFDRLGRLLIITRMKCCNPQKYPLTLTLRDP